MCSLIRSRVGRATSTSACFRIAQRQEAPITVQRGSRPGPRDHVCGARPPQALARTLGVVMNPSMVCRSSLYSASASAKEPFMAVYRATTWTTRPTILDNGTVKRFLGTAGADCTGRVVSRAKWSLSKYLTRKVSAVYVGILIRAT
ncbi:hypothetical protein E2C01_077640 [Portunus trituberculatus]|uniref:Uncharacterized protein n=1 Tax=Portunus trituberculatus TaxID=210409 RepID=A0A5B7IBY1_PORTR|nr:hypothetical protein [Portunus trituberculatus]